MKKTCNKSFPSHFNEPQFGKFVKVQFIFYIKALDFVWKYVELMNMSSGIVSIGVILGFPD